jgi:MFS family permease
MSSEPRAASHPRTFWGFAGDLFFFGIGLSFASQTTVVPAFLASLTSSAPLIGLAATIGTGGWLVPQLFAAKRLGSLSRRKATVAIPGTVGRFVSILMGPAMFLLAPRSSAGALAVFYLLYTVFWISDGFASVGWLDIMGRCLDPKVRARLISLGTVAPGIAGIGAGAIVGVVLSSPRLPWPGNYALLFGLCAVSFTLSLFSFLLIKESPAPHVQAPLPWPAFFRRMASVVKADPAFRRAVISQLAVGSMGIAAPFYIVNGLERLGFPPASIGLFTSVQLVGGVFAALVMGVMGERRGTRSVMRLWARLALAAPMLAIAAPFLGPVLPGAVIYVYALVFVLVGMQGVASLAGFLNWVLEYAPASDRPLYIGFANTLNGLTLVMPLIGGWILSASGSWYALFAASAAGPIAAVFILRGLPEPRRAIAAGYGGGNS